MHDFDSFVTSLGEEVPSALRVGGTLVRSPFAGRLYPSELFKWPVSQVHEYRSLRVFEHDSRVPILVSPGQRDAWLAAVVMAARRAIPGLSLAVIRLLGAHGQLPAALLDTDVLLVHEPDAVVLRSIASGHSGVLSIWQDLRTDGIEAGSNEVTLSIHGRECVQPFVRFAGAEPNLSVLEWKSVQALAEPVVTMTTASKSTGRPRWLTV
jgi:hypothetical protein